MTAANAAIIAALISVGTSAVFALVAWGLRGEVRGMRGEVQLVRSEMQTELANVRGDVQSTRSEVQLVRSEMQTELAQAEVRFYQRVNGNYVRREIHQDLVSRVDRVESRVDDLG